MSTFCRRAIFDYIRRKENPELFNNNITSNNPEMLEEIMQKTKKMIELQELTNKKAAGFNEIEEYRAKIKEIYNKLRKEKKVSDFSKEIQEITDLLKIHNSLTPQRLSNLSKLEIEDILLIIETNNNFKLNISNGKVELK